MKSQKASLDDQVKRTRIAVDKAIKPQVGGVKMNFIFMIPYGGGVIASCHICFVMRDTDNIEFEDWILPSAIVHAAYASLINLEHW